MDPQREAVLRKIAWRFVPLLTLAFVINYLDRTNIGVASLTMNQDLELTATQFGLGAGIFFIGYIVFEIPSNLVLYRLGARRWIARIMISWGILSGLMAFIPDIARATGMGNENAFYLIRVLLGAAEAGFFPGIIFYLTLWFPAEYRATRRLRRPARFTKGGSLDMRWRTPSALHATTRT